MQHMQLWIFWAIVAAFIVCGCILTRKPRKKLPTEAVRPAVPEVGERHIARQQHLLAWLEQANRGKSESAKVARDVSATFEKIQALYVADRDRLTRAPRRIAANIAKLPELAR